MYEEQLALPYSFKKEHNDKMQFIYASQLYGTFFGIFAQFETTPNTNDSVFLDKVYLKLINYKGIVNLGITQISNPFIYEKKLHINIKVKAFQDANKPLLFLFTTRQSIANNQELIINRELDSFAANTTLGLGDNYAFDSEFFERDGYYCRSNTNRFDSIPSGEFTENEERGVFYRFDSTTKPNQQRVISNNVTYLDPEPIPINKEGIPKLIEGGRCPRTNLFAIM